MDEEQDNCDQCGIAINRKAPHFVLSQQMEQEDGDEIEVLDSEEMGVFCSKNCLDRFSEE